MDHFNVTIQNGQLVSTRRGLQVQKHKYNGLSFVNSYASRPKDTSQAAELSGPGQRRFKFVSKKKEAPYKSAPRLGGGGEPLETTFFVDGVQQQAKKRSAPKRAPARHSPASSSSSSSTAPSAPLPQKPRAGASFRVKPIPEIQDAYQVGSMSASIPSAMPTWPTHNLPSFMTEDNRKLFHSYFSILPRKQYPFEDILTYNPSRTLEFYGLVVKDLAALHCVLMCGTIFHAVSKRETESKEAAYHISQVCAIINRKLDRNPKEIDSITLECITTLALTGSYIGRLDHWHVHMRGLQRMMEMGQMSLDNLRPALLAKIRKTDLKGATVLASKPYLPFTRYFAPVSNVLPEHTRSSTSETIAHLLNPIHIAPVVTSSLVGLSLFLQAFRLAHQCSPPRSVLFDPHGFTEEWHWVQYQLLCEPGPLRKADPSETMAKAEMPPVDVARLRTENYIQNHHLGLTVPVIPTEPMPGAVGAAATLEPALRICGLLLIKELIPDFPRNLGGYGVLLDLLGQHLRTLVAEVQSSRISNAVELSLTGLLDPRLLENLDGSSSDGEDFLLGDTFSDGFDADMGGVGDIAAGGFGLGFGGFATSMGAGSLDVVGGRGGSSHDSHLSAAGGAATSSTPSAASSSSSSAAPGAAPQRRHSVAEIEAMKPAVLWACLVGHMAATAGDENEQRVGGERYDKRAFREALLEVAGLEVESDVDALTGEDLGLCRMLELRSTQGERWDDRAGLKRIISGAD